MDLLNGAQMAHKFAFVKDITPMEIVINCIIIKTKMPKKRKIILIIGIFVLLALASVICILVYAIIYSYTNSGSDTVSQVIPNTDIVYEDPTSNSLGFINADGTGKTLVDFQFNFRVPVVSKDGNFIYGTDDRVLSHSVYWDNKAHKVYICNPDEWGAHKQVVGMENPDHPEYALVDNNQRIILLDIKECKIVQTIFETGTNAIYGISYNADTKQLLYGLQITHLYHDSENRLRGTNEYQLRNFDLVSNENTQIAAGVNPSWSPDGLKVSFTGVDGLYVMNADGSNSQRIFVYPTDEYLSFYSPYLHWSPDGRWLVYEYCEKPKTNPPYTCEKYPIYIISSSGGSPIQILDDGWFPFWMP
jgi:hypothetical protein